MQAGSRLGSFEILALLGTGGMGEVYRARDTKLQRDVALKVLPEEFSRDPERLARSQREAHVLAALNHPNIASIYGLEEINQTRCIVMELVEGETLAARLKRGRISIDEALPMARQMAEALEAAHDKGIVHRDLKPGNVMVLPDDRIKVLDFGLAKAMDPGAGGPGRAGETGGENVSRSPTLTTPAMTQAGMILGTAAYMAPEQAKGKNADAASDVWAFGCILYEMLTGSAVFTGETISEVLAGVLKSEPDWHRLPAGTPEGVRRLLRRCLQKDRKVRPRDVRDVRIEIDDVQGERTVPPPAIVPVVRRGRERLLWSLALIVAVAATAISARVYFRNGPADAPEARLQINPPPGTSAVGTSVAISPDGRKVVFQAASEGKTQLWMRPLESDTAQPLAGTENSGGSQTGYVFWSPDSQSIGFFAAQKLKVVGVAGGTARTLADAPTPRGGAWNTDGTIVFAPGGDGPLYRISASGGQVVAATAVQSPQQASHRFPQFLPDGQHFLFFATGTAEGRGVYVGSLDSKESRRLFDADVAPALAAQDYVLFGRQETLFAQRLDLKTMEPSGNPFPVAEGVSLDSSTGSGAFSGSLSGLLAYRKIAAEPRPLIWFDRSGKQLGTVGAPDVENPDRIRFSPDGRTIALTRSVGGNLDVWLMEMARGVLSRFTVDAAYDSLPLWSPDGNKIIWVSNRKGPLDVYQKSIDGAGVETLLLETSESKNLIDWSRDGRFILYSSQNPKTARDIWALPVGADGKSFPVVQTAFEETGGGFSPDGKWIAYHSNESGRNEVYVQPFPGPGRRIQVSTNGGVNPQWRGDGKEIFYGAPDRRLMAVPVLPDANGAVEPGTPVALFAPRVGASGIASPDGQRFLLETPLQEASIPPITVVLNWKPKP